MREREVPRCGAGVRSHGAGPLNDEDAPFALRTTTYRLTDGLEPCPSSEHEHAMIMLMPILTRRLQVLLDEERYAWLQRLAQQRGTTVAALVRDALDRAYPVEQLPADVAADRFLSRPPVDLGSWEEAKHEIEDGLERDVAQ